MTARQTVRLGYGAPVMLDRRAPSRSRLWFALRLGVAVLAVALTASAFAPETRGQAAFTPRPCASAPAGMSCVTGASFVMGVDTDDHVCDQPGNSDRAPTTTPAHRVEVSTFLMDTTEVTNGAYQACVAARDCPRDGPRYRDFSAPTQAITGVSWFSARAFCAA